MKGIENTATGSGGCIVAIITTLYIHFTLRNGLKIWKGAAIWSTLLHCTHALEEYYLTTLVVGQIERVYL